MAERKRLRTAQESAEAGPAEAVRLPLDLVDPNPQNPRRELAQIDALAENIKTFGLLQPVTVQRQGERYQLLGGHRRLAAFQHLRESEPHDVRWASIPAVIRTQQDEDTALRMLISGQVHIADWKPREEAAALERLAQAGNSLERIGHILHKDKPWVSKRLRVYADVVLSGMVQSGQLKPTVAEELLRVTDLELKKRLAEQTIAEQWTQEQLKARIRAFRLDRQLAQIGKLARQLAELLSVVAPADVPISAGRELMVLHGRIEVISGIRERRLPTIAQAEKVAGVKQSGKQPRKRTRFRET